jgi:hypothetical protein
MRFWYRWAIRFRGRYMAVAVKWFALRAGVEKTRGKTRREDLRGDWWGGVKLIVCSAFVRRIIQDVIKNKE